MVKIKENSMMRRILQESAECKASYRQQYDTVTLPLAADQEIERDFVVMLFFLLCSLPALQTDSKCSSCELSEERNAKEFLESVLGTLQEIKSTPHWTSNETC